MLLLPDKTIMPACGSTLYLVRTSLSLEKSTELFGRCDIYRLGTQFTDNWRRKGIFFFFFVREEGPDNLLFAFSFPNLTVTTPLGLICGISRIQLIKKPKVFRRWYFNIGQGCW